MFEYRTLKEDNSTNKYEFKRKLKTAYGRKFLLKVSLCFFFLLLLLFIFCLFANCFSPGWVVTEAMTAFLGRESCKHKQHICNTVWLKNGQHVSVQNNKGGKPQTNTNSNRILWKKVKGIKSLPCWSFCFDCLFVSAFFNKIYTWIEFTTPR